jgi:hypothetical protein
VKSIIGNPHVSNTAQVAGALKALHKTVPIKHFPIKTGSLITGSQRISDQSKQQAYGATLISGATQLPWRASPD